MTWFVFLVLVLREPGRPRSSNEHMDGGMLDTVYPMSHSHCAMSEVGRLEVGVWNWDDRNCTGYLCVDYNHAYA